MFLWNNQQQLIQLITYFWWSCSTLLNLCKRVQNISYKLWTDFGCRLLLHSRHNRKIPILIAYHVLEHNRKYFFNHISNRSFFLVLKFNYKDYILYFDKKIKSFSFIVNFDIKKKFLQVLSAINTHLIHWLQYKFQKPIEKCK